MLMCSLELIVSVGDYYCRYTVSQWGPRDIYGFVYFCACIVLTEAYWSLWNLSLAFYFSRPSVTDRCLWPQSCFAPWIFFSEEINMLGVLWSMNLLLVFFSSVSFLFTLFLMHHLSLHLSSDLAIIPNMLEMRGKLWYLPGRVLNMQMIIGDP